MEYKNYSESLKNSCFKILCLFEENNKGLTQYIDSLIYELHGLQYLLADGSKLISLISILEHFYDDSLQADFDISVIRREVFHCIDMIEKMRLADDESWTI